MKSRPGYEAALEQLEGEREQGHDVSDDAKNIRYHATLATLLRVKRRVRVPPPGGTALFDYDKLLEERFPKNRGKKLDPSDPPDVPFHVCEPECAECETCWTQYFPARISLTDAEALACVQSLTTNINADLEYLRQKLDYHADFIVTRWKKKSKAKRTDFLTRKVPQGTKDSSKPLQARGDGISMYEKKWAAIHFINDHSLDPTKVLDKSVFKHDPIQLALAPYVDGYINRLALEDQEQRYQTTWLLPYLDVETLADDPLLLLSLLHYRTAYAPVSSPTFRNLMRYCTHRSTARSALKIAETGIKQRLHHADNWQEEWMMFDIYQLKLTEHWQILIPEFNRHCVTMVGPKYGMELVKWDKHRCHHWWICGFRKAHHILSAQREMMRFLRMTVQTLLEETNPPEPALKPNATTNGSSWLGDALTPKSVTTDGRPSPKWDQLVQNDFFSFGAPSAESIRASANQPFSSPPHFSPIKTLELVESMFRQSADELELAQTDPAYLQYLVRELANTLCFELHDAKSKWEVFIDEIIFNMYRRYIWWRQTVRECRRMVDAYVLFQQAPSAKTTLEYEKGISAVWDVATEHLVQQILLLDYSLPFQRGFERNYVYGKGTTKADGSRQPTIDDRDAFHKDKLFWSLKSLGFDEHRLFSMEPAYNFRVLDDHLSHANRKEQSRVSERLLRQVSEMAVLEEIRTSILCNRNWTRELPQVESEIPDFRIQFIEKYAQTLCLPAIIKETSISQHLRTLCTAHQWPKGIKDAVWLERAAESRKHLSRVWTAFRVALKAQQQRDRYSEEFIENDWAALSAAESPAHLQAIEEEGRMILGDAAEKARAAAEKLASSAFLVPTQRVNGVEREKFVPLPTRSKKKTRGPQTESDEVLPCSKAAQTSEGAAKLATQPKAEASRVFLRPENVGLFESMYSSHKTQTRSYSWKHFLGAMADAGFAIIQSSGSAVSFKKADGVIVFHRPHPEPNIDPILLMAMGKRLNKWFGFGSETFEVKRGQDDEVKA